MKLIERSEGRIVLKFQAVAMGTDLCLVISGGDRPHLGAVAVALVRESLDSPGRTASTVSNITLPGHKEDELARRIAARVAAAVSANVAVCCGIHLDRISPAQIERIVTLCDEMTDEFLERYR